MIQRLPWSIAYGWFRCWNTWGALEIFIFIHWFFFHLFLELAFWGWCKRHFLIYTLILLFFNLLGTLFGVFYLSSLLCFTFLVFHRGLSLFCSFGSLFHLSYELALAQTFCQFYFFILPITLFIEAFLLYHFRAFYLKSSYDTNLLL